MTDFEVLIDRAVARRTRGRVAAFLATYDHVEFGVRRKLDPEEASLVLAAMDAFYKRDSAASLGTSQLSELSTRLAQLAATQDDRSAAQVCRLRNACFDALAALKAMEARLTGLLNAQSNQKCAAPECLTPANDLEAQK